MISVIVPTHNEELFLQHCLDSVTAVSIDRQIIIVDGGSRDRTLNIARKYTEQVISLEGVNLAEQLNRGASAAEGEILLFLHADSQPTPGSLEQLEHLSPNLIGGAFTMQLEGKKLFYRLLSMGGNLYCRLTGTYFGDRGIFVRKPVFEKMGGFSQLPIMADVEFSRRMRTYGKTALLKGPIISSSRKFDEEGAFHTLYLILYALLAYRFGMEPGVIKRKYYHRE